MILPLQSLKINKTISDKTESDSAIKDKQSKIMKKWEEIEDIILR